MLIFHTCFDIFYRIRSHESKYRVLSKKLTNNHKLVFVIIRIMQT